MNLIEQRTESKEPEETLDTTAASNRLRITETRGSTSWVHTYEYTAATNTWTYTSPGNLSEVSTRIVLDGTAGTREYITTVKQPGGPVIARNTRKYKMYSWGEGLIEKTDGSGTSLRTTTYTYTANGYANGTHLEKHAAGLVKLATLNTTFGSGVAIPGTGKASCILMHHITKEVKLTEVNGKK